MSDINEVIENESESGGGQGIPAAGGKPPRMDGVPAEKQVPKAPVEAETKASSTDQGEEIDVGNPLLNTAIKAVMAQSGATTADLDRIATAAINAGDMSKVDYAYLYDKFKDQADTILDITKNIIASREASEENSRAEIFELAGGEANWKTAVGVFNQNAPQYLKTTVKHMLDNGDPKEGANVLLEFVRTSGFVPSGTELSITGAARGAGNTGLSAANFIAEMGKLKQEAGNHSLETGIYAEKYNALIARRQAGRAQGL